MSRPDGSIVTTAKHETTEFLCMHTSQRDIWGIFKGRFSLYAYKTASHILEYWPKLKPFNMMAMCLHGSVSPTCM